MLKKSSFRTIGRNYEYRVVNFLKNRGWSAYRVPVSGVSRGFKNDVYAHLNSTNLEVECTKTSDPSLIRIPISKINKIGIKRYNGKDILLIVVFALSRSPHYCIIPETIGFSLIPSDENMSLVPLKIRGSHSILIKKQYLQKIKLEHSIIGSSLTVLDFNLKSLKKRYFIWRLDLFLSYYESKSHTLVK